MGDRQRRGPLGQQTITKKSTRANCSTQAPFMSATRQMRTIRRIAASTGAIDLLWRLQVHRLPNRRQRRRPCRRRLHRRQRRRPRRRCLHRRQRRRPRRRRTSVPCADATSCTAGAPSTTLRLTVTGRYRWTVRPAPRNAEIVNMRTLMQAGRSITMASTQSSLATVSLFQRSTPSRVATMHFSV